MSWFAGDHCRPNDDQEKARKQSRLQRLLEEHCFLGPGWEVTYREEIDLDGNCLFGYLASPVEV